MRTYLLVVLALLLAACNAPPKEPPPPVIDATPERIVAQFEAVAFGQGNTRVTKWTQPNIRFAAALPARGAGAELNEQLPAHRQTITNITRIEFAPAGAGSDAEMRLIVAIRRQFRQIIAGWLPGDPGAAILGATQSCTSITAAGEDGRMTFAGILVGSDISDGARRHCALEEMVQAMGLPGNACVYRPSLFCDEDRVVELAGADAMLLRVLYDPRLKPGMAREDAMARARTIVTELWQGS